MKKYLLLLIISCSLNNLFAQKIAVDLFPENKIFQKYYADALSHQFSLSKHLESSEWFGNIGAILPIADLTLFNEKIQISAGATVFNTLIKTPGHIQVFTVDYLVDFYGDYKFSDNFVGRFVWGHLSAHFSDDGITQLNYSPVSYVRDYAGLHFQRVLSGINGKVYLGGFYNFHNEPAINKHTTFQIGADAGYHISEDVLFYCGVDLKIKSEVNNGTTQSYQLGIKFPASKRTVFRFVYTHRRGFEERGQLYSVRSNKNTIGIFIDF